MKTVELGRGIQRIYGPLVVEKTMPHKFKTDRYQAQIRQTMTDIYPGGSPNGELVEASAFGFKPNPYPGSRVAFADVPVGMTVQQAQAIIDGLVAAGKEPCVQRVMSLEPIMNPNRLAAIAAGRTTKEIIGESQRAYATKLDDKKQPIKDSSGKNVVEPLFYAGKPFYREFIFKKEFTDDIDYRPSQAGVSTEVHEEHATAEATAPPMAEATAATA